MTCALGLFWMHVMHAVIGYAFAGYMWVNQANVVWDMGFWGYYVFRVCVTCTWCVRCVHVGVLGVCCVPQVAGMEVAIVCACLSCGLPVLCVAPVHVYNALQFYRDTGIYRSGTDIMLGYIALRLQCFGVGSLPGPPREPVYSGAAWAACVGGAIV